LANQKINTSGWLVVLGSIALNALFAMFGTAALEVPLRWLARSQFPPHSWSVVLVRDCVFTILLAALASFVVSLLLPYQWCSRGAQRVWILCAIWFVWGCIHFAGTLSHNMAVPYALWQHFSGTDCAALGNWSDCNDFFIFTFPLLRGASYSLTAWFAFRSLEPRIGGKSDIQDASDRKY
jgi:hypothetical protein